MHCTDTAMEKDVLGIQYVAASKPKHYGFYASYHIWMDREGRYCDSNIEAVKERVAGLLKGCWCKTGCQTQCCGYKGKGKICSEGCECTNCLNTQTLYQRPNTELDDLTEMSMEEIIADCPPRDDLVKWVFGDDIGDSEDEEDEHDDLNMYTSQLHHDLNMYTSQLHQIHALRSYYTTDSDSACVYNPSKCCPKTFWEKIYRTKLPLLLNNCILHNIRKNQLVLTLYVRVAAFNILSQGAALYAIRPFSIKIAT